MRSHGIKSRWIVMLAASAFCALTARPAAADLWTATNSGDNPAQDKLLDASANFTIKDGQIVVTITNLLDPTKIVDAGQTVSDLKFTITGSVGTNSSNSASGQLVQLANDGSTTAVSGDPGRWVGLETDNKGKVLGGFNISGNTITLEAIGGGQPNELILPSSNGGAYSSVNSSLVNAHQPSVDGPATFTLNLSGVTSATQVTAVQFSFGTGPDTYIDGSHNVATPEPSSLVLSAIGAGLFGAFGLYRKRRGVSA